MPTTLLIISTIVSQYYHNVDDPLPRLCTQTINTPVVCEKKDAPELPNATYDSETGVVTLPKAVAEDVKRRLLILDLFPTACQETIQANRDKAAVFLKTAQDQWNIDASLAGAQAQAQIDARWAEWEVGIAVIVAVAGGFLIGYGTARVLP